MVLMLLGIVGWLDVATSDPVPSNVLAVPDQVDMGQPFLVRLTSDLELEQVSMQWMGGKFFSFCLCLEQSPCGPGHAGDRCVDHQSGTAVIGSSGHGEGEKDEMAPGYQYLSEILPPPGIDTALQNGHPSGVGSGPDQKGAEENHFG